MFFFRISAKNLLILHDSNNYHLKYNKQTMEKSAL